MFHVNGEGGVYTSSTNTREGEDGARWFNGNCTETDLNVLSHLARRSTSGEEKRTQIRELGKSRQKEVA